MVENQSNLSSGPTRRVAGRSTRAEGLHPGAGVNLPSVSVIIPTKNRPDDLGVTLETLFRQSVLPTQLIIVDQSASDESRKRFESLFEQFGKSVRETIQVLYVWDSNISGGAAARNRAMELATGEVWLFLDDDVEIEPNFIEEILKVYIEYPQVGGVSGVITNYQPPARPYRIWARLFVRGPFHDERQPIYWAAESLRNSHPIPVNKLSGGLMSFRSEFLSGVFFDKNLRGVSDGEDWDFTERVRRKTELVISPRVRLKHLQSPIGRSQDHHLWRAAKATHFIYRKNWDHGVKNRLCFAWLNLGYILLAISASIKRGSTKPVRDFWDAIRGSKKRSAESSLNAGKEACRIPSGALQPGGESK